MKVYDSEPLPISLPYAKYKEGTNNSILVRENDRWATVKYISNFIKSNDPRTKLICAVEKKLIIFPLPKLSLK